MRRQQNLMETLIVTGLMPQNKTERKKLELIDPYTLRKKGLDEKLTPYELGRALFHINQRRGFQSNRKQAAKDKEAGAINDAKIKLETLIHEHNYRTIGEFLYYNPIKRVRPTVQGSKSLYDFYPQRDMLKQEFDLLMTTQAQYYPSLLEPDVIGKLKGILFFQRNLRPVQKGRCSLMPEEARAYSALPSSQHFRVLKEVNNLNILDKLWRNNRNTLTDEQREKIITELYKKKKVSFDGLRKTLKLDSSTVFNLESEHRDTLEGATTSITLSKQEYFGDIWKNLTLIQQDEIVEKLLDDTLPDDELSAWLKDQFQLNDENIKAIMNVPLEDGTLRYSTKAIHYLLSYLEKGKNEHEARVACKEQGLFPNARGYDGQILDNLPYYGELLETHVAFGTGKPEDNLEKRYGKIPNPTVHIALNQLRKLINELIPEYGRPAEIAIELSRDLKLTKKEKDRLNKEIAKNTKENALYDSQIESSGLQPNPENRLRLKLHAVQKGLCAYSGKAMQLTDALSDRTEIDHILPFSRTFDDTTANKVLVFREYNRIKGNLSPYEAKEAFEKAGINYDELLARTGGFPGSKKWRFLTDAMKRFEEENQSGDKGWLARQLNDTSYMARVAREYLRYVVGNVDTYPGGVTAKLRHGWGFNSLLNPGIDKKNRDDHRHHAIDALVVACANRSMLNAISKASGKGKTMDEAWFSGLLKNVPSYSGYNRSELQQMVDNIIISHKPDHGSPGRNGSTTGRLHEDTFYGYVSDLPKDKIQLVVSVPFLSLKEKDIQNIRDETLRNLVWESVERRPDGQKIEEVLAEFSNQHHIRHVRLLAERSRKAMKAIRDKAGKPYRYAATGSNHHIDIFCPIKDKKELKIKAGQWYAETVSTFDANQKGFEPQWRKDHPTAKLVMRLHINDMVAYDENGKREIRRVKKIDAATERVYLVSHLVANEQADKLSWAASANLLQKKNARKIAVTQVGKVFDPGKAPMPKPFRKRENAA